MATANISRANNIAGGSAVVPQVLSALPAGRTLDFTDYNGGDTVKAGHAIYKDKDEYKPIPIEREKYRDSVATTTIEYVGILLYDVSKDDPRASIVTAGQVNAALVPYPITENIKNGLPRIEFLHYEKPTV